MEIHPENNGQVRLIVICVAYKRVIPLRILIDSFLVQTSPLWELQIIHDGPAPEAVVEIMLMPQYKDPRIKFTETAIRKGKWGHPNRGAALVALPFNHRDFVLITNDDNYYVPRFVEFFLRAAKFRVGMIMCDTVHSYLNYEVLSTRVKTGSIDMGSFIVRLDVAKKIGFKHECLEADGKYAEECNAYCRKLNLMVTHIKKPLFIHN